MVVDLLPAFLKSHPEAKPNSFLFPQYELSYEIVPSPKNVLILGAGTRNDVAAALRHGAEHIDAVELDPVILRLGKQYHPEHPYSSTNVTSHVDDARAFLKKSDRDVLVIDDGAMAPAVRTRPPRLLGDLRGSLFSIQLGQSGPDQILH